MYGDSEVEIILGAPTWATVAQEVHTVYRNTWTRWWQNSLLLFKEIYN
jgi:hypothetical protein